MKKLTEKDLKAKIRLYEKKVEYYEEKLDKLNSEKTKIGFKY